MKNTLEQLDSAIEQWDSITNKAPREQATGENPAQQKAKELLKQLREQLDEFDSPEADKPRA